MSRRALAPTLRRMLRDPCDVRPGDDEAMAREVRALLAYVEHSAAMHNDIPHAGLPCKSCDLLRACAGSKGGRS